MALMDPDASDEMTDHLVDFFDQVAPVYDSWAGGQHVRIATRLVELVQPKKRQHALDVGTGTGLVAHLVAAKVSPGTVIGIDLSDRMLSIARSKQSKNTQFLGMAAERLVFKPETFDLVTMGDTLAYLSDPGDGLSEAHRVLKAGGRPLPYTLIRALGPRYRMELEAEVEAAMDSLGDPDDAFRYHHSYLMAVATKR